MDPVVRLGLTEAKMQSQQGLEFIGLFIGENEKEFVLHRMEFAVGSSSGLTSSWLSFDGGVLGGGVIDF